MQLTVKERIMVLNILPAEGNFVTLKIIGDLKSALSFTEEELKSFEIKEDGGRVTWNQTAKQEAEISVGPKATSVIAEALEKMDRENKLTVDHLSIYEKFVDGG